jgi:hypothetical protein
MRRIATVIATLAALLALSAAPALAHFNESAGKGVGPRPHAAVSGTPGLGHAGMECGAQVPQTPLEPLGLDCPANR